MKRRNFDCGKLRRPIKRNKITESMYGRYIFSSTTVIYMKFMVLWAIVITADFMFKFRFECLWPLWLVLRFCQELYQYRGTAYCVLIVCVIITSDLVCLFFIPVDWLLLIASTYMWIQYVWHTDRGLCLPTIFLWLIFIYLEAGIRWKDERHTPHLDFCRPFAAHCIGYTIISAFFSIKSYVLSIINKRKQRVVRIENDFYFQLLLQGLPQEKTKENTNTLMNSTTVKSSLNVSQTVQNISTQNHLSTSTTLSDVSIKSNGSLPNHSNHNNHNKNESHNNANQITNNNITISSCVASTESKVTAAVITSLQDTKISTIKQNGAIVSNNIFDEKDCIQIGGTNATTATFCSSDITAVNISSQCLNNNNNHANNSQNHNHVQTNQHQHNNNPRSAQNNSLFNGHLGGSNKNSRRSDKENKTRDNIETSKQTKSNNSHQVLTDSSRDKTDCDSNSYQIEHNSKIIQDDHRLNANSSKKNLSHNFNSISSTTTGIVTCEVENIFEKNKGRRNRSKKDHISKDNHGQSQHNNNNSMNNSHSNNSHHSHKNKEVTSNRNHLNVNHNSDASSVSSSASSSSTASTISNLASKVVSKICESCLKLEADIKKYRTEMSHMKQSENELRQKLESNLTTKSCLQAKQKECDQYEKKIQELTNSRHADMLQLQSVERRLTEERRQKQSFESQLNSEKKARKLAEEKAARPECSIQCRQRKQVMEDKIDRMQRDLKLADEAKQLSDQQGRKWEQKVRMFEAEIRTRDSNQPDTEMLMNALAAMQDKNATLEKNLSAETRVKLDLFSALGDAKRQLEISENRRRAKDNEVLDLKAKIAQLLAVIPNDPLCLPPCNTNGGTGSLLRMNETPPLQTGSSPASPMLNSLNAQQSPVPGNHQLTLCVVSSTVGEYVQQVPTDYVINQQQQQHQQQHKCSVPVSVAASVLISIPGGATNGPNNSNLDPNATVYTPKCGPGVITTNGVMNGSGDA